MNGQWIRIALGNLVVSAAMGAVLRYAFIGHVPGLDFMNFLHGHSHVAMLGWVYLTLFTLFMTSFLSPEQQQRNSYRWLFWATQVSVFGMLVSFPVQGYAAVSITFSTLHVLFSYGFAWLFLKDLKQHKTTISTRFAQTAVYLMLLSTVALFAMPPIMILGLKGTPLYFSAVQFFLHFQINGWFTFGVLALLFRQLEQQKIVFSAFQATWFYRLLLLSCVLTYALVIAWSVPHPLVFAFNSLGVLLQLAAGAVLVLSLRPVWRTLWAAFEKTSRLLVAVAIVSFFLKIAMQTLTVLPDLAVLAFTVRNFVIGFLHLTLLGTATSFLLAYSLQIRLFSSTSAFAKTGILLFVSGFALSEILLFVQGILLWGAQGFIPMYYELLFGLSLLMPLGLALFGWKQFPLPKAASRVFSLQNLPKRTAEAEQR